MEKGWEKGRKIRWSHGKEIRQTCLFCMSSACLHDCIPLVICAPCYFSAAAWLSSIDWDHCQGISPYSVGSQSGWTRVFTYQSPRSCLCQCYEVHQGVGIWRPKCNSQAGEWFLEELFWLHRPLFSVLYFLNKESWLKVTVSWSWRNQGEGGALVCFEGIVGSVIIMVLLLHNGRWAVSSFTVLFYGLCSALMWKPQRPAGWDWPGADV